MPHVFVSQSYHWNDKQEQFDWPWHCNDDIFEKVNNGDDDDDDDDDNDDDDNGNSNNNNNI